MYVFIYLYFSFMPLIIYLLTLHIYIYISSHTSYIYVYIFSHVMYAYIYVIRLNRRIPRLLNDFIRISSLSKLRMRLIRTKRSYSSVLKCFSLCLSFEKRLTVKNRRTSDWISVDDSCMILIKRL